MRSVCWAIMKFETQKSCIFRTACRGTLFKYWYHTGKCGATCFSFITVVFWMATIIHKKNKNNIMHNIPENRVLWFVCVCTHACVCVCVYLWRHLKTTHLSRYNILFTYPIQCRMAWCASPCTPWVSNVWYRCTLLQSQNVNGLSSPPVPSGGKKRAVTVK